MELIVLMGIPASGKSSFYKRNFFTTYMRISLDLFNTRNKERQFLNLALSLHQRVVIDNTNVVRAERADYIRMAREKKYSVTGYYFESKRNVCIERNEGRKGKEKIERKGILYKHKMLELPAYEEGFDKLYYVSLQGDAFTINDWKNEI